MILAFGLVELFQPLSQPVRFDPGYGIVGGIEGARRSAEHLRGDVVLLQMVALALKILLPHILQKLN
jgi:hypothetical protein